MQEAWLWTVDSAIHHLLYLSGVYPADLFHEYRPDKSLIIMRTNNPPICTYINQCLWPGGKLSAEDLRWNNDESVQIRLQLSPSHAVVFSQLIATIEDDHQSVCDEQSQSSGDDDQADNFSSSSSDIDDCDSFLPTFQGQLLRMLGRLMRAAETRSRLPRLPREASDKWSLERKTFTIAADPVLNCSDSGQRWPADEYGSNLQIIPLWQTNFTRGQMFVVHLEYSQ